MNANTQKGFTLLELMVVLVIIGILAALAVPTYQGQVKRAKFAEVVGAVAPIKAAVQACIQKNNAVASCGFGSNGVPADPGAFGMVASIGINTTTAAITATGTSAVDGATYILTPSLSGGVITWAATGTCATTGLC